jgi:BirA family biotin operon repressor/biotin-[acetyl-CoA-carboxylase] ligase
LRPDKPAGEAAQFSFVTALAMGYALDGLLSEGVQLSYKWPNDLLLNGRKVAGILLESSGATDGRLDWLVIGVGLNIDEYPADTDGYPATSLRAVGASAIALPEMLVRFVEGFAYWREQWQNEGLAVVRNAWLAHAAKLGEEITVRLPNSQLNGRFEGLDENGALLLDGADGTRHTVTAGDVFF